MSFKMLVLMMMLSVITGCASIPDKLVPIRAREPQLLDPASKVIAALDCLSSEFRARQVGDGGSIPIAIGDLKTSVDLQIGKLALPPSVSPNVRQALSRVGYGLEIGSESMRGPALGETVFRQSQIVIQGGIVSAEIAGSESFEADAFGISGGRVTEVFDLTLQLYLELGRAHPRSGQQVGMPFTQPFRLLTIEVAAGVFHFAAQSSAGLIVGNFSVTQGAALGDALKAIVDAGVFILMRDFAERQYSYESMCELDGALSRLDHPQDQWNSFTHMALELSLDPVGSDNICLTVKAGARTPAAMTGRPRIDIVFERGPGMELIKVPHEPGRTIQSLKEKRQCWPLRELLRLEHRTDRIIMRMISDSGSLLGQAVFDVPR